MVICRSTAIGNIQYDWYTKQTLAVDIKVRLCVELKTQRLCNAKALTHRTPPVNKTKNTQIIGRQLKSNKCSVIRKYIDRKPFWTAWHTFATSFVVIRRIAAIGNIQYEWYTKQPVAVDIKVRLWVELKPQRLGNAKALTHRTPPGE